MQSIVTYIKQIAKVVAMVTIMSSCGAGKSPETELHHHEAENTVALSQAQYEQADIQLGKIEKKMIGSELRVNGIIDVPPKSNISINMPYGGFVEYTEMLPGSPVKRGQVLVRIENPEFIQFQQDYLESIANQEYLKAEYERQERLYKENVASEKNYQQAKSSYLANEARIKTMEARLKLIGFNTTRIKNGAVSATVNIYSPVTGNVREIYTNTGKYINPQDVIMDITNREDLHVELSVYENDIPKIKNGQRIRFSLANAPDQWREAEVFLIGSGVREDRSVTVHGHLKEHYVDLLPGMYVMARIDTDLNEVWAVPDETVVRFGGKHYVFTYDGLHEGNTHAFEMTEVIKGISEDGYTGIALVDKELVIDELQVVTGGAFTLLAKAKNTEEEGGGHHH
ncbi:efflux RND transporter periplasmic adaptor subunit [Marinoscillum sp. MHG1-6]|uniref:efflux RND transporter periplasmic adaptor subunit n=1 Tax=Marinoscillum sp. MHG1-6 TaxID=2959627 RepID=UPI002156FA9A|nr:efflux RND transporter periplasmic adaptor subunit [Marinoscillum sp. MHG1-6]